MLSLRVTDPPRYLFLRGDYAEGEKVLKNMLGVNSKLLSEEVFDKIKEETGQTECFTTKDKFDFILAFKMVFLASTVKFTAASMLNLIPLTTYGTDESNLFEREVSSVLIASILDIPSIIASGIIPNIRFIGRKGFLQAVLLLLSLFLFNSLFVAEYTSLVLSLSKTLANIAFTMSLLIASEQFSIHHKGKVLALCCLMDRLAKIVAAVFIEYAAITSKQLPVWLITILALIQFTIAKSVPKDTN